MHRAHPALLVVAIVAAIPVSLAACGGDDDSATETASTQTTEVTDEESTSTDVAHTMESDSTTDGAATPIELHPYTLLELPRPDGTRAEMADPEAIKVDDTWYLYGTTDREGFEMWSSTDLVTWEYGGLVWRPTPGSWNDHGGYWAPGVLVTDNGVWLYYTAGIRIGVARADSPEGPFVDQLDHPFVGNGYGGVGDGVLTADEKSVLDNWDDRALDASVFVSSDGSLTLYFSALTPFSEIRALPLADETTPAADKPTVIVPAEGNIDSWEAWTREGPYVVEHDGVLHLMYSGNDWRNACYAVGVATATHPLGPFTRRPDNPLLASDVASNFLGPGHNSVVAGPDGGLLAFFHIKLSAEFASSRNTMYAPVEFDNHGRLRVVGAPSTDAIDTKECREPKL